jgi:hypothetical protein
MSYKILPSYQRTPKNKTFFYKSPEIRFKELLSQSVSKPVKRRVIIERDPWRSMKEEEVLKLIERLEDRPEDLYHAIQGKQAAKNKFTLLNSTNKNKENANILKFIEDKKKYYESEFRTLLKGRKTETLKILLPKL